MDMSHSMHTGPVFHQLPMLSSSSGGSYPVPMYPTVYPPPAIEESQEVMMPMHMQPPPGYSYVLPAPGTHMNIEQMYPHSHAMPYPMSVGSTYRGTGDSAGAPMDTMQIAYQQQQHALWQRQRMLSTYAQPPTPYYQVCNTDFITYLFFVPIDSNLLAMHELFLFRAFQKVLWNNNLTLIGMFLRCGRHHKKNIGLLLCTRR